MEAYIDGLSTENMKDLLKVNDALIELAQMLARSSSLVSESSYIANEIKKRSYQNYVASSIGQNKAFQSAMLIKDYISSKCAAEASVALYADRINRAITHTLETLRTVASSLREEYRTLKYQT